MCLNCLCQPKGASANECAVLMRLAIINTHPIQYQAHWFRRMAREPNLDLEVFYIHQATPADQASAGFGVEFDWDTPLLGGYPHRFLHNVARPPAKDRFSGLDTPEIGEILVASHYDAVLVSGWHYKSAWQAFGACWRNKIPLMVRSDSHLHTYRHPLKALLKEIPYRWFVGKLDACLAVGRLSSEYFLHYGAALDRIFLTPHAVDPTFEAGRLSLLPQRSDFRNRWGFEANHRIFLFAGKFTAVKRPLDFIRAVRRASEISAGIVGLMVGDGPLRDESERLATQLRAPVRFAGFLNQSQIGEAYTAADVLVLPSSGETWGLVVNEAMTYGRPCLVSDRVGCGPDLIVPGETGFTFPVGNVNAMAKLMTECVSSPEVLLALGERARRQMDRHSVEVATEGVRRALERVTRRSYDFFPSVTT